MRRRRVAGYAVLASLIGFAVQPATSAARPAKLDQSCMPPAPCSGYYGTTLSQSFRPKVKTIAAVDVLLVSVTAQRPFPRIRLVGQHDLPEGLAAQTVVLTQQQRFVPLAAYRPTWVRLRLPKPLAVASGGPTVDQFAIQVELRSGDDSVLWLVCEGYLGGTGQTDFDPGSAVNRDTGTAIVADLPRGLAFREYSTSP